MGDDGPAKNSLLKRLFILARLTVAWLMWANMAIVIGMGKAEAGLPANTPEWNKTWEDYRRWAFNPPDLTPVQRLNAKYMIPAILLMYSGVPVRMLTDRLPVLLWWGAGCWVPVVALFLVRNHKAGRLGEPERHRAWATVAGATVAFAFTYAFTVFFTGVLLLASSQMP